MADRLIDCSSLVVLSFYSHCSYFNSPMFYFAWVAGPEAISVHIAVRWPKVARSQRSLLLAPAASLWQSHKILVSQDHPYGGNGRIYVGESPDKLV